MRRLGSQMNIKCINKYHNILKAICAVFFNAGCNEQVLFS